MSNSSQIAVVTGGAGGIGAEVVHRLAQAGRRVAVLDVDESAVKERERSLRARGFEVYGLAVDVTRSAQVRSAFDRIAERWGHVDILVNNVGGNTTPRPIEELSDEEVEDILRLNLLSAIVCTRAAVPGMKIRRWGRIVNLSSIAGRTLSLFSNAVYTAAKAAVIGFTRQCAAELAPHGIMVNSVAHGVILTERVRRSIEAWSESRQAGVLDRTPAGRFGTVAEAAAAVEFLCSQDAGYVAGAVLDVNGGLFIG